VNFAGFIHLQLSQLDMSFSFNSSCLVISSLFMYFIKNTTGTEMDEYCQYRVNVTYTTKILLYSYDVVRMAFVIPQNSFTKEMLLNTCMAGIYSVL